MRDSLWTDCGPTLMLRRHSLVERQLELIVNVFYEMIAELSGRHAQMPIFYCCIAFAAEDILRKYSGTFSSTYSHLPSDI